MQPNVLELPDSASALVQVRQQASGTYVAEVVGMPDVHAEAARAEDALAQVREKLIQCLHSGKLVALTLPTAPSQRKPVNWAKDDRLEREFLEDLARMRQEDLERTLREYEQEDAGCSNSSSTPTI
jgi:predicted RNase H-like HicB family nuclease